MSYNVTNFIAKHTSAALCLFVALSFGTVGCGVAPNGASSVTTKAQVSCQTAQPASASPFVLPASGIINTVAGVGTAGCSGDGSAAASAQVYGPSGAAVDAAGNLYIADSGNNRIRKVTASTGIITTIAGTGTGGFSGDGGVATSAELNNPNEVAVDAAGNVYIADTNNQRIRKVSASSGDITTIAGTGTESLTGDGGLPTSATLVNPFGVAVDAAGNVYIANFSSIREVTVSTGLITTVAGTGTSGFSGDGGLAKNAQMSEPYGVAVDASGNLYISDYANNRIRKVTASTGIITTIAGTGTVGFSGDGGLPTNAELNYPEGVAVDAAGNVYISDTFNELVRKVTASTGIITTFAGNGTYNFRTGDGGVATSAEVYHPGGLALDVAGNLYIADSSDNRIRVVGVPATPSN